MGRIGRGRGRGKELPVRLDDKKAKGRDPMLGSILRLAVYGILFAARLTGCTRREETGGTEPVTEETTQRPSEETEEKPTEPHRRDH